MTNKRSELIVFCILNLIKTGLRENHKFFLSRLIDQHSHSNFSCKFSFWRENFSFSFFYFIKRQFSFSLSLFVTFFVCSIMKKRQKVFPFKSYLIISRIGYKVSRSITIYHRHEHRTMKVKLAISSSTFGFQIH